MLFLVVVFALAVSVLGGCESVPVEARADESVRYVDHLFTKEWKEWQNFQFSVKSMNIDGRDVDGRMEQDALVKVLWKDEVNGEVELFIRLDSGWIGLPKLWVRGMAEFVAQDFCEAVGGLAFASCVKHETESKRTSGKLVRRDHRFIYRCGAANSKSGGGCKRLPFTLRWSKSE